MVENRQVEWRELMGSAEDLLNHPERIEPAPSGKLRPAIRLWRYPAFGSWNSWLLFTPLVKYDPKGLPVLRTVEWAQDEDGSRLLSPMEGLRLGFHTRPSVTVKDCTLLPPLVDDLLEQLRIINLAAFAAGPGGCDGTIFGVETLDPFCSARVSWWAGGPPEFAPVKAWYDAALLLFTSLEGEQ
jgi:hypothetical protein